eukprot:scaffold252468_cov36-Tisochrysis_lutea.AAC.1
MQRAGPSCEHCTLTRARRWCSVAVSMAHAPSRTPRTALIEGREATVDARLSAPCFTPLCE